MFVILLIEKISFFGRSLGEGEIREFPSEVWFLDTLTGA